MARRTDQHRKGAIIPAEYEHVLSYNTSTTQDGWPIPSFGINCELDRRIVDEDGKLIKNGEHDPNGRCCVVGLIHVAKVKWATHGNSGKCTACGASFVYGEVWKHTPTGEHIHVGHICGDNYGLLVDRSAFELEAGRRRAAAAAQLQRELNRERRADFLTKNPGLEEALKTDHHIIQDIAWRFQQYCELSKPQVALVFKIVDEIKNPKPEEQKVPAPIGKQTFQGVIKSTKVQDSYYGAALKCLVRIQTEKGHWVAWGTVPQAIIDATKGDYHTPGVDLKGCTVEITATLEAGREDHFVFMKRPRGRLIAAPEKEETK